MSAPNLYLGLDVHKDSITVAVFGPYVAEPKVREMLPDDMPRIRRFLQHFARERAHLRDLLRGADQADDSALAPAGRQRLPSLVTLELGWG